MSRYLRIPLLVLALILIGGAILFLQRTSSTPEEATVGQEDSDTPALIGLADWINSEPVTLRSLQGKVVLLDFWTYTCINCLRTVPYLQGWYEAYADDGLVILGIHSPEFNFEKKLENVGMAVADLGVTWPVALDNDRATWRAFKVRGWPTKIILDREGNVQFQQAGEGGYSAWEERIRSLLAEGVPELELAEAPALEEPDFGQYQGITREIYGGFFRRPVFGLQPYIGNPEGYREEAHEYTDSLGKVTGSFYLHGLWRSEAESIIHARDSEGYEDYISTLYFAGEVNTVIRPLSDDPIQIRVTLDEMPVPEEARGADVYWDEDAQWTFLTVKEPRMYRLIDEAQRDIHELRLYPSTATFALHAYTFGP